MDNFRRGSHKICGLIWVSFLGLLITVLMMGLFDSEFLPFLKFMTILALIWAIWSTPAPPYQ